MSKYVGKVSLIFVKNDTFKLLLTDKIWCFHSHSKNILNIIRVLNCSELQVQLHFVTNFVTIYIFRKFASIMNNARFATLIHILTLLAKYPNEWLSSDWIASSIQINPVIVRRELLVLQNLGWVASKKGKEGGTRLLIPCGKITLADIYQAVKNTPVLGKKNSHTNPHCPVGKEINHQLEKLFAETDQILIHELNKRSLNKFVEPFL